MKDIFREMHSGKRCDNGEDANPKWRGDSDSPSRESMSAYRKLGFNAKERYVSIVPLRRALRANVGNMWDAVYSDICKSVRRRKERYLVLEWLEWLVDRDCFVVCGVAYRYSKFSPEPVRVDGFCVIDGVLCYQQRN